MSDDPTTLVEAAATRVRDPVTGRSVWLSKMVRDVTHDDGALGMVLAFQAEHTPDDQKGIEAALRANLGALGWTGEIQIQRIVGTPAPARPREAVPGMSGGGVQPHGGPIRKQRIEGVTHVIAVASGKGGVGKSTVSTNLAVALRQKGLNVGLLDADIYGPSLPTMMNVTNRPMVDEERRIIPPTSYGVRCLSAGMLVEEHEAIIWRGPMVMNLIRQFLQQARWGHLDVLVVDMPPGTGDAQLTLIQGVDLSGAVVVTTPQQVALADAVRGISMFTKLGVPLLGMVENMAWYELPDGERDYIFGEGGGQRTAERYEVPLLAQIPLVTSLRRSADQGLPAALGKDSVAEAFGDLADAVIEQLAARSTTQTAES